MTSENRLENRPENRRSVAYAILEGFNKYFARFQEITSGARERFINADWQVVQQASVERLDIRKVYIVDLSNTILTEFGDAIEEPKNWVDIKAEYIQLIRSLNNYKIAESFFNSTYCSIFSHRHIDNRYMFVYSYDPEGRPESGEQIYKRYPLTGRWTPLVGMIFNDFDMGLPFKDKDRDIHRIVRTAKEQVLPLLKDGFSGEIAIEVLRSVFYRSKAAYIVGRIVFGDFSTPFVLPILNDEQGSLKVDTLIIDSNDVSVIFSFTRSYFMVESSVPREMVSFLQSLMPQKGKGELFNSIGFCKHGKSEFYRNFLSHMDNSDDKFVIAPGIKGMVMSVFTLPSCPVVFKLIKDKFDQPKTMTREEVKEKYRMVSRHDRVGRMADTQEFSNFIFERERFSSELIEELNAVAPSLIEMKDDKIIIKHLYTERKMIPLNLYLRDASEDQIEAAMDEYGNAIKQLSAANIFPGDMLFKNFGVTRHGRVVFYDYDEICPLTQCNFRKIPEPRNEREEFAATPWYTIGPDDIFPEEFGLFFTGNPKARKVFGELHGDLYEVGYWQGLQERILAGHIEDVFPYRRKKRFEQVFGQENS